MKGSETSTATLVLAAVLGGELLTLLTGLVPNTPPMLVGAVHHGYPLPWLIRLVIAPQYNPWRIELLNFLADIVVWSVIVGIVIFVVGKSRKPS